MADILLSELTNADIDWLAATGQQQHLSAGTQFSSSDDLCKDNFCLILDGKVFVLIFDASDSPFGEQDVKRATQFLAGEVIGAAALFNLEMPPLTFQVVEESILLTVPLDKLKVKLTNDLTFAANFYRAVDLILSYRVERLFEFPEKLQFSKENNQQDVLDIFGELRDSDLNWLVKTGRVERYSTNDFLLKAGRPTDFLYIVLDGAFSVSLPESKVNPLALCFECPTQIASTMSVVDNLSKGEIAGAIAFLDARPMPITIRALRESLVLAIPRTKFNLHIQQDLGFATRFYRILGPQLFKMSMIAMEIQNVAQSTQAPQAIDDEIDDIELDLDSLQRMSNGANRFNWMLSHLGVGVS